MFEAKIVVDIWLILSLYSRDELDLISVLATATWKPGQLLQI